MMVNDLLYPEKGHCWYRLVTEFHGGDFDFLAKLSQLYLFPYALHCHFTSLVPACIQMYLRSVQGSKRNVGYERNLAFYP